MQSPGSATLTKAQSSNSLVWPSNLIPTSTFLLPSTKPLTCSTVMALKIEIICSYLTANELTLFYNISGESPPLNLQKLEDMIALSSPENTRKVLESVTSSLYETTKYSHRNTTNIVHQRTPV